MVSIEQVTSNAFRNFIETLPSIYSKRVYKNNLKLFMQYRGATEYELNKKNSKIYVDGANPSVIKSLKLQLGEDPDYDKVIARYKSQGWDWTKSMVVIPINFSTEHKAMLGHAKMMLEDGYISIDQKKHDKLITSLRTAVENEGVLDKEVTRYNDIFDAFRLALRFYSFKEVDKQYE